MTADSKVGYQPKPLPPSDYKEFLKYRQATNTAIREAFFHNTKRLEVRHPKKKSKSKYNGEPRNRDRSK